MVLGRGRWTDMLSWWLVLSGVGVGCRMEGDVGNGVMLGIAGIWCSYGWWSMLSRGW